MHMTVHSLEQLHNLGSKMYTLNPFPFFDRVNVSGQFSNLFLQSKNFTYFENQSGKSATLNVLISARKANYGIDCVTTGHVHAKCIKMKKSAAIKKLARVKLL